MVKQNPWLEKILVKKVFSHYISLFPTSPYPSQNPRARHQEERRDPTHSTGRDSDSNKNTSNLDHPLFSTAWETSVANILHFIRRGHRNAFLREQIGDSFLRILNTIIGISNTDLVQENKILKNKLLNYINLNGAKFRIKPLCSIEIVT